MSLAVILAVVSNLVSLPAAHAQTRYVDYRFAPQWCQTTPAFPDDSFKTLVGAQGQLLYDWGGGKFFPISVNDGFKTVIHMMADEDQRFSPPSLVSARVPAVRLQSRLGREESPVEQYIYSSAEEAVSGTKMVHPLTRNREDIILTMVTARAWWFTQASGGR